MKKLFVCCALSFAVSTSFGLTITSDANGPVTLPAAQLKIGDMAPKITLVDGNYAKQTIGGATGKVQIISTIESFNTPVCDEQTMILNKAAIELKNTSIAVITTNQPFVVQDFQQKHKINNIKLLSAFNDPTFGKAYGVQVVGGELTGITARAVFVVNKQGVITYKQITQDIDKMPDMKAAIEAARKANA